MEITPDFQTFSNEIGLSIKFCVLDSGGQVTFKK